MIVNTASRINTVKEYYFSIKLKEIARRRQSGERIINLGIGSPDLPPATEVIETLVTESRFPENHAYQSYVGIPELRNAFADWYQQKFAVTLDPNTEVLPLMGSKEGIMHISMTFLETGDEVLLPNPGYPAYQATANLTGATTRSYDLTEANNWMPDLEALARQDLSKVKLMWINYPHMPTGTAATTELFQRLVNFAKKHKILICNDNPYSFILNDQPLSLLAIPGAKEVALELNSLSKSHNMAGWRVGMLGGKKEYLEAIIKFKSNMDSGMFRPVQLAAVKALAISDNWYQELNAVYQKRQRKVFEIMDALNCTFDPQQTGMFVWAKIPEDYTDSYQLSDEILNQTGVFVTPGGIFGSNGEQYIRISLCTNERTLEQALGLIKNRK